MRRLPSFTPADDEPKQAIDRLEADANYFWEPDEAEWVALAARLGVPVSAVKSARFTYR